MTTEIWQDFDPNLDIPVGLVNTQIVSNPDVVTTPNLSDTDIQDGEPDNDSDFEAEDTDTTLAAPQSYAVVSQVVRTGPDGTQVVDVVVDVEDVPGALEYEVRVTPV